MEDLYWAAAVIVGFIFLCVAVFFVHEVLHMLRGE